MRLKHFLIVAGSLCLAVIGVVVVAIITRRLEWKSGSSVQASVKPTSAGMDAKEWWHCGMHPQVIQDHPGTCPICHMALTPLHAHGAERSTGGPNVRIDPSIVQNMGVRTAPVTRGPLSVIVRAVGMVKAPEPGLHDVTLKIGGWIDTLQAQTEGMHVSKGQVLFELYSPDLQVTEQELITATRAMKTTEAGGTDEAKKESRRMLDSVKQRLRFWDIADEDIEAIAKADSPPKAVPFRSPSDGEIVEKMVVQGSAVQPGMKLMRIEEHSTMWLDVDVYEQSLPFISIGQHVEATISGLPGKTFTGQVSFVHPHVDMMTRTQMVRATLENRAMELHPGMYASAQLTAKPIADATLAPREAVIDTGARQIAFVAEPDGSFAPRTLKTGLVGEDDKIQIIEGLSPGEQVVTSGQFLMDVESRTTEAVEKLRNPMEPAAVPSSQPSPTQDLIVANCNMKKADWVQKGDTIKNPYFGSSMTSCGDVVKKLPAPPKDPALASLVDAYLRVEGELNADQLNPNSLDALRKAADSLPADRFAQLKQSTQKLTDSKALDDARAAFKTQSADLIHALERA